MSLFYLAKSLQKHQAANNHIDMILLSRHADIVTDQDKEVRPENAALIGLGKAISLENPNLKCRSLDIDDKTDTKNIITEINSPYSAYKVAYRDNERYAEVLDELDLNTLPEKKTEIKEGNVYLISGGTGGLGLAIAKYLSQQAKVKLALLSRNPRKLPILKEIEKTGSEVLILSADVADEKQLSRAIATIRKKYKKINGIIHAAGVAGDGFIIRKDETTFKNVLAPKITGTWMLNRLTEKDKLDFFISFSSTAAIFSTPGQGDYTAANAYLDAFAKNQRAGTKCRTLSINWSAWQEIGMAVDKRTDTARDAVRPLTIARAMAAFTSLLARDMDRASIMVGEINYDNLSNRYRRHALLIDLSPALEKKTAERPAQPNLSNALPAPLITPPVLKGKKEDKDYTDMEKKIAAIWQEVLGYKELDVNDNFFELGGDSLLVIRVQARIKSQLGIDAPISELFNRATVKTLSNFLDDRRNKILDSPSSTLRKKLYGLSHAQKRIWIVEKTAGASALHNLGFIYEIEGDLNLDILKRAIQTLINRHDALKTSFTQSANGDLFQIIKDDFSADIEIFDLEYSIAKEKEEILRRAINKPFDLSGDRLFRVLLIKTDHARYCLVIIVHHIVADYLSLKILSNELKTLYNSYLKNEPDNLFPQPFQYGDYIEFEENQENGNNFIEEEVYWLKEFSGELPVLNLPEDFPRPPVQAYNSKTKTVKFDEQFAVDLDRFSKENKTTIFVTLLTFFYVFLYRITDQTDIIVGTFSSDRKHKEWENMVGLFVNSLAIRIKTEGGATVAQILQRVKRAVLTGMNNDTYPFERLVEKLNPPRDLSRFPIFNVIFQVFNKKNFDDEDFNGATSRFDIFANYENQFDIALRIVEEKTGLFLNMRYNSDLFKPETIDRFVKFFRIICRSSITSPDKKIGELKILSLEDKHKLIHELNDTGTSYPKNKTLPQLFEEQVKRTPDHIALEYENQKFSYEELNQKANRLAHYLKKKHKIKPDNIIGLMLDRSPEMLIGIIAILKVGGAYLPLDPEYPEERIKQILSKSGARLVLTNRNKKSAVKTVNIGQAELLADFSVTNPKNTLKPDNLAYVIYTSGSTGEPKGVAIEHRSVVNFIAGMSRIIDFEPGQKILASTNLTFDISVLEMILPLTRGLSIILSSGQDRKDPQALVSLIKNNKINIVQFTPSMIESLMGRPEFGQCLDRIKFIILGGERLTPSLLGELREITKKTEHEIKIYNAYGPTETTVWSTIKELTDEKEISVGQPIGNTQTYVLDKNMKPFPVGIPGELYISGDGLARGYLNDPERTRQVFLLHPLLKGKRMYKTGDLAKMRPDGNIEILGRIDHQIKLRGHRIEPGEIEAGLRGFATINNCVVTKHQDGLAAYYTSKNKSRINISDLKFYLRTKLPGHMIPTHFVQLKEFPLSSSGKIDRKKLLLPDEKDLLREKHKAPQSAIEKELCQIWQDILRIGNIGINDNFFDIGGNSLLLIRVHQKLEKFYPDRINIAELFTYPTIAKLAEHLSYVDESENISAGKESAVAGDDIAIVGLSLKTSLAESAEEFWQNLVSGRDSMRGIPEDRRRDFDRYLDFKEKKDGIGPKTRFYPKAGYLSEIDKFDYSYFKLSPKEASLMDPNQRLFLQTVYEAIDDAGEGKRIKNSRTGLYAAYSSVLSAVVTYQDMIQAVDPAAMEHSVAGNMRANIPG